MTKPVPTVRSSLRWLFICLLLQAVMLTIAVLCIGAALEFEQKHALVSMVVVAAGSIFMVKTVPPQAELMWRVVCDLEQAVKARRW